MTFARRLALITVLLGTVSTGWAQETLPPMAQRPEDPTPESLLDRPARLNVENVSLEAALLELTRTSGVPLAYSPARLPKDVRTSCPCDELTLRMALERLLAGTSFRYSELAAQVVLFPVDGVPGRWMPTVPYPRVGALAALEREGTVTHSGSSLKSQTGTILGRVTDSSTGEGIPSVDVVIEDTRQHSVTNDAGLYRLEDVPAGSYQVTASRLGYADGSQRVTVVADQEVRADFALQVAPAEAEEIVVTGSRIRRAEGESPSPVTILTREDLDRSGRATVAEALAQLPQNLAPPIGEGAGDTNPAGRVNLRGLGADNTLVLVNSRRVAYSGLGPTGGTAFVDLNSIPLAAVERIEVMTDGGSAIYGSDAVAGVVNIILKRDFSGLDVNLGYGASSEGGAGERRASFVAGGAKGALRGLLSGEVFDRDRLLYRDRSFSRSGDQTARGGRDFRTTSSNPGNVFSLDGENLPGLDASSAGIPAGQDGRNLTPTDFAATAGQLNLEHLNSVRNLVAASERWGLNGRLDWELGATLGLFAETGVTHNTFDGALFIPPLNVIVPASNPFNPFGKDVRVQWLPTELGPRALPQESDNLRALGGLEGRVGHAWTWESSLSYSRNEIDSGPFIALFNPDDVTSLLSRTDPATALNVFGDGAGTNAPAVLEDLTRAPIRLSVGGEDEVLQWAGHLDGVLAEWAGREVRAAVGAEYRGEGFDRTTFVGIPQGPPTVFDSGEDLHTDRDVVAGFVELSLPLFGPEHQRRGARSLELQLAGRWESYSDFGETFNPKVALRWQPIVSLALRASASTGFRAPSLFELFDAVDEAQRTVSDPRRNNETVVYTRTSGPNPDLEPEDSESWNLGLAWDVPVPRGLSLTADVYGFRQDDQIATLTADQVLAVEPFLPGKVTRAEPTPEDIAAGLPGRLLAIDTRLLNVSVARVRGVDLGVHYLKDSAAGRFDLRLNAAYIDGLTRRLTPVAPVEHLEGTTEFGLNFSGSPARFRSNLILFWSRGVWELGVTERYTGRLRDTLSPVNERVDDHLETDLQVNYMWPGETGPLAGIRLSLGVENLFNTEPPFQDTSSGFTSALYSPRQRFSYLTLTKSF